MAINKQHMPGRDLLYTAEPSCLFCHIGSGKGFWRQKCSSGKTLQTGYSSDRDKRVPLT